MVLLFFPFHRGAGWWCCFSPCALCAGNVVFRGSNTTQRRVRKASLPKEGRGRAALARPESEEVDSSSTRKRGRGTTPELNSTQLQLTELNSTLIVQLSSNYIVFSFSFISFHFVSFHFIQTKANGRSTQRRQRTAGPPKKGREKPPSASSPPLPHPTTTPPKLRRRQEEKRTTTPFPSSCFWAVVPSPPRSDFLLHCGGAAFLHLFWVVLLPSAYFGWRGRSFFLNDMTWNWSSQKSNQNEITILIELTWVHWS